MAYITANRIRLDAAKRGGYSEHLPAGLPDLLEQAAADVEQRISTYVKIGNN